MAHNPNVVPVYGRAQRDLIWSHLTVLFPALKKVGRDEIMGNDLLVQGLRLLIEKRFNPTGLRQFYDAMRKHQRPELEEVEVRLPVYNRSQRDVIALHATRLFPELAELSRDDLVAADLIVQALRLAIEAVYAADAEHDQGKLRIPALLAYERFNCFEGEMEQAYRSTTRELAA